MYRREREVDQEKKEANQQIIERSLLVAGILALAVAVPIGFLALGCGKQSDTVATNAAQEQTRSAHDAGQDGRGQIVVASTEGLARSTEGSSTQDAPADTGSQPVDQIGILGAVHPDVVATAPETVVEPGTVVEITAEGSPDVSDMILTDRLAKKTAFTYDTERSIWRVSYRVPLKSRHDLIDLSVTATNRAGLSKRIWVFLKFREPTSAETVQTEPAN